MASASPKNILITGGARGIGRCLARHLLQDGHKVFLLDHNETELTHTVRNHLPKAIPSLSGRVSSALCNLRQPSEIKAAIAQASTYFAGHLDVLINNAGIGAYWPEGKTMADVSLDEWNAYIETNLTGNFLISQACLPLLSARSASRGEDGAAGRGGCIINISSTRAHMSEPNSEGYATTKAGLLGLTHAMASSLSEQAIRVNAIAPGWIHVGNECKAADEKGVKWEDGLSKDDHRWHFAGRVGKGEDVVKAVRYLMEADFVTGEEMIVDGGVTRRMVYPEED